jgi:hypothetical protein
MLNQENKTETNEGALYVDFQSDAMKFQPGSFVIIDGLPMVVMNVQKDTSEGGYRVHLKEEEMPRGTFPLGSLSTKQD